MKGWRVPTEHRHAPPAPDRERFTDPERVLDAVRVEPGMTVAHVGAGAPPPKDRAPEEASAGAFTLPLARRVGERGKVYAVFGLNPGPRGRSFGSSSAVDVESARLTHLEEAVESGRWPQIVTRVSRDGEVPVPDAALDAALLVHVLHELDGIGTLVDVRRALKPDGELHVVDRDVEPTPTGPPLDARVGEKAAIEFVERAGYRLVRGFTPGAADYGLTFKRA